MSRDSWCLFVLILLGLTIRTPLLGAPFYYDDVVTLEQNTLLRDVSHWPEFFSGRVDSDDQMNGSFRPLLMTAFSTFGHLTGFTAGGWRMLGFMLHALNALLVFAWGLRIFGLSRGLSIVAAALFFLHPIQNTSLAIIWKQSDLWAAFFVLSSGLSWAQGRIRTAFALFLLGLGFKESVVITPAVWFLLEAVGERRSRRWGLAALGGVLGIAYLRALPGLTPAPKIVGDGNPFSPMQYFWTQLHVVSMYLRALVDPTALTLDRGVPVIQRPGVLEITVTSVLLASVAWAAWALLRHRSKPALAGLLAIVWLVPTSSFKVLSLLYDETRVYAAIAFLVLGLAAWVQRRVPRAQPGLRSFAALGLAGIALNAYDLTRWTSTEAVWSRVVKVDPCSARGHAELARQFEKERALDDAEREYRAALACTTSLPQATLGLGRVLGKKGDLDQAESVFQGLRTDPYWMAQASYHLGLAKLYRSDRAGAKAYFLRSHDESPSQRLCEKGMALLLKEPVERCESLRPTE